MAEAEEQGLVQELVPHPSVERLADAVLLRLSRGAMKCQAIPASWVHASMAFEVNSVPWSDTIS